VGNVRDAAFVRPRQPGVAANGRGDRWRDCVVDRIGYNQELLANASLDRADRAIALKFLVHLIGDLHQPFHALGVERGVHILDIDERLAQGGLRLAAALNQALAVPPPH
jgi:hypothetical protein